METVTDFKLNPERLFPVDPKLRGVTRELYQEVKDLPLISPHGHTDPQWFASNRNFTNATELFLIPDHYLFRMLFSQGISLESLGISRLDVTPIEKDHRRIWQTFADHFYLFRGTPSRIWFEHALHEVLGIGLPFNPKNADRIYDEINEKLIQESFQPRALFERFNLEVLATTESPLDELVHHRSIADSGWNGRVITAFRPDPVVDPEFEGFSENIILLGQLSGEDTTNWKGYLNALMQRRAFFKSMGATSTDHGHPSAVTANLEPEE
ncbi:MAG: glucuronate isomerase, partial [SAR324 cluster bacterium]|nr:glucuronate isomerase [SAR324 cluster bacterium]